MSTIVYFLCLMELLFLIKLTVSEMGKFLFVKFINRFL